MPSPFSRRRTLPLLLAALAMPAAAPRARALTTYDANTGAGGAQDGAGTGWNTTDANWWDGGADILWPNTNADEAIFGAGSGAAGTVAVGTVTANKITFNAPGSGNYTLTGGTITLAGTAPAITTNANATIGSVLAGAAGLTKDGTGTLTLTNNANTYSVGTVISNGTISATGINRLTTDTNKDLTFGDAGTTGGAVLQVNMNGNFTLGTVTTASSAAASNILNIATSGGSTLAMTNAVIGTGAPLTLRLSGGGLEDTTFNQVSGAAISGGAGSGVDSLIIDLASGQTLRSSLTLNTANTFTGNVLIQGTGTWQMQNMAYVANDAAHQNFWIPDASSVTVQTGATWSVTWGDETIDGLNGGGNVSVNGSTGAHTLTVGGGNGSGSFSGVLSGGNTSFTKTGSGTQILSGTNTYSGTTAISGGTLQIGNGGSTGTLGAGAVTNNATLVFNRSDAGLTVANAIGGSGAVTQNGTGTTTLSGMNSYTGATTVNNGTLLLTGLTNNSNNANVGAGAANGQLATSAVSVASGATFILNTGGSFSSANGGTTLSGAGTLRLAGGTWWLGNGGGGTTIAMSAGGVIDVQGGGTTLKNDYSNANWAGNQGSLNIGTGANFNLRNNNVTVDALTGSGAIFNDFSTNTLTIGVSNTVNNAAYGVSGNTATFSGTIGAGGTSMNLVKTGSGTQILSGTNTYTGNTTVNGGTLAFTAGGLTTAGQITAGGGTAAGTLSISNSAITTSNNGTFAFNVGNGSNGTVNMSSGSLGVTGGASGIVMGNNGTATWTQTGGTVTHAGTGGVFLANIAGGATTVDISGGSFTTASTVYFGVRDAVTLTLGGTGTLSVATLSLGHGGGTAAGTRTLNLNTGGTLTSTNGIVYGLGTHTVNLDGGTLRAGSSSFAWNNNASVTATIGASGVTLDSQAFNATTAQVLGGTGGLAKTGSGTWTLSGNNAYSGGTTVSQGTLRGGHVAAAGTGTLTLNDAGTGANNTALLYNSGGTVANNLVVANEGSGTTTIGSFGGSFLTYAGTLTLNRATTLTDATGDRTTFNGLVSGNVGTLTIGAGRVTFGNANNTFTGDISVASGATVQYTANNALGSANNVVLNGTGAIQNGGAFNQTVAMLTGTGDVRAANPGGTLFTVGANDTSSTFAGRFLAGGSGGNFVKTGTGTFILTNTGSTFTQTAQVNGGTFQLGDGVSNGSWAAGINLDGASTNLTFNNGPAQTFAQTISGTGSVTKIGSGVETLSVGNSYSGLTTVSAGTLEVTANNALGTAAGKTTVDNGAALKLNGVNYATAETLDITGTGVGGAGALANAGTSTYAGQINVLAGSTGGATIHAGGGTLTLTGGIVKNGTVLTLAGGGTLNVNSVISGTLANSDLVVDGTTANLNAANTYNGPTFIRNGGVLNANVAGALPVATRSAVTLDDSGTGSSVLNLGASQVAASLAGPASSSSVTLGANTLTIGTTAGSTTFQGTITGTGGGLTKDGASTQILSGANSYTGATTVNNGTLLVNGTHAAGTGGYTVNGAANGGTDGATLGGYGTITTTGGITIRTGAQITGGNLGSLSGTAANNILNLNAGTSKLTLAGTYLCDINFNNLTGNQADGAKADLIQVTGDVDLTGAKLNLSGTNIAPSQGSHYAIKLLSWTGSATGATSDWNTANITGLQAGQSVVRWGNAYYLVPEPASFALLSLGGLLLLRRPSRRRGRQPA